MEKAATVNVAAHSEMLTETMASDFYL